METGQKKAQQEWYDDNRARCSLSLSDRNNEVHLQRLKEILPPGSAHGKILEIGCGTGWYSGKLGPSVSSDISLESLRKNVNTDKRLLCDAENLPFADETFDFAYGFGILHHLEDIERGLIEVRRVLKPGAYIAFGSENSSLCPLNYLFPVIYGNWHIEKGFTRISPGNLGGILKSAGYTDFTYRRNGFAVYGMNEPVYRATKTMEDFLERSEFLKRFSGFMYLVARKAVGG